MSTMLRKLWDTTFHLEGKFLRSCWQLFIPGKVTTEFFKGKQDRYPHPLRMFAIVMFLFLYLLNTMLNERHANEQGGFDINLSTDATETSDTTVDEKSGSLYERMKYRTMLNDIRLDYEQLPVAWQTPTSRKVVDSLLRKNNIRNGLDDAGLLDSIATDTDTLNIGLWGDTQLKIATMDIVRYEPDEIIRRYHITNWMLQLFLRQTIKSYKNPDAFIHSYIGSLTWTILALVALMSSVLALLYRRQKRYYVEHFIFLLHFHTGLMLALLLAILGVRFDLWGTLVFLWIFLGASFFMYKALRRYYKESRGKTIAKWLIFGILYYFGFIILFILGTLLVFAMY
jgi:hypothetical protein